MQTQDKARVISLPRLKGKSICPYAALKVVFKLYQPGSIEQLFQERKRSSS